MTSFNPYFLTAGGLATLVVVAGWAERRRARRNDLNAVGFMPWNLISVLAMFGVVFALAFGLKT